MLHSIGQEAEQLSEQLLTHPVGALEEKAHQVQGCEPSARPKPSSGLPAARAPPGGGVPPTEMEGN
eukprot:5936027-Lingulodinium_polyedra.AAC.1